MSRGRIQVLRISLVILGVFIVATSILRQNRVRECPVTPATDADFAQATSIGDGVFEPERWELQTGEHPGLISVGWFENDIEALAHGQLLLYNCGYTQAEIDDFYDDENMNVMLGGYESHTQTAECTQAGLTLREYDVGYEGRTYKVRFWIEPLGDTRVRDMHLGFFPENIEEMDAYARRLYPDLPSCSEV